MIFASQTLRECFPERLTMWPPYSPDLSPIESVWATMANMLRSEFEHPRTKDEMAARISDAWRVCTRPEAVRGHYDRVYLRMCKSHANGGTNAMH
jgi:transposase